MTILDEVTRFDDRLHAVPAPGAAVTRPTPELAGRKVLVVGLARTGLAAAEFLLSRGAKVTVNDLRPADLLADETRRLEAGGARVVLGEHPQELFREAQMVVVSPGVPLALPVFAAARAAGAEVIAEIELAARFLEGTIVAVTGSNGKSTTTSLVGEMLRAAGLRASTCGNIGVPFIAMAATDGPDAYYALEVSSFQLEATRFFRPRAAVLTHITPDHLDRYAGFREYVAAKARIFEAQGAGDHAILNDADPESVALAPRLAARVHRFSSQGPVSDGGFLRGDQLILAEDGREELLADARELPIPGRHNVENVLAAAVAARAVGAPLAAIRSAALAYRALPHRLELVGTVAGVDFYNDSKATNVDAAAKALASFPGRPVWIILGGRDKGGDFASLGPLLRERAAQVLTIGEAAGSIERQLLLTMPRGPTAPTAPPIAIAACGDLATAVREGFAGAKAAGGVVLLAPACASFDQFRNYEDRGEQFRALVRSLMGANDAT